MEDISIASSITVFFIFVFLFLFLFVLSIYLFLFLLLLPLILNHQSSMFSRLQPLLAYPRHYISYSNSMQMSHLCGRGTIMIHDLSQHPCWSQHTSTAMSRHPEVTVQSAPQSSNPTKSQNSRWCMAAIVVQFTYRILTAYAEPCWA